MVKCTIIKNKSSQFHLEAVETGVVQLQKKADLIGYSDSGAALWKHSSLYHFSKYTLS